MNRYGLIGYPLTHSFSKKYFSEKFLRENIAASEYQLYEMADVAALPALLGSVENLRGLNVTIPHKQAVIPLLDELDPAAARIGAVNVIKVEADGRLKGYNSDYYGFKQSLLNFTGGNTRFSALVLGAGGAARAVVTALEDLGIAFRLVSRQPSDTMLSYEELGEALIQQHRLIINTTPLGMYPNTESCPDLPYGLLGPEHYLFDLVYNPEETLFMKKGSLRGAAVKNGLEMLYLQAEKAWEIWNTQG